MWELPRWWELKNVFVFDCQYLQNICLNCEKTPEHGRLYDFCGSFPDGGSKSFSVSGSQNFLFPFLIVHSHETGREVTNASLDSIAVSLFSNYYKITVRRASLYPYQLFVVLLFVQNLELPATQLVLICDN